MAATGLQELRQTLQTDRLIKIYVGEKTPETKPFLVQQSTLEQTAEYFCKAFKHEHLGTNSESGTLNFPDDDIGAWELFLYWVTKHSLPSSEEQLPMVAENKGGPTRDFTLVVRSWALGDKYNIPAFQDEVMLEPLRGLEVYLVELSEIREAFERTPPGSKLRDLMAEDLAETLKSGGDLGYAALDRLDGVVGFTSTLARKLGVAIGVSPLPPRVPQKNRNGKGWQETDAWRKYMVGAGPKQHWIHERK